LVGSGRRFLKTSRTVSPSLRRKVGPGRPP